MSAWELSNEIEKISYRIDSVRSIIELVAASIIDETESSALWGCSEMLEIYADRLDALVNDAMDLHREEKKSSSIPEVFQKLKKGKI